MSISALVIATVYFSVAAAPPSKSGIVVSKETTHVLRPTGKDGWIDYRAALDELLGPYDSPGNAARILAMALGPEIVLKEHRDRFFRKLGIEVPVPGTFLISSARFAAKFGKSEYEKFVDQLDRGTFRPWTPRELPQVESYLKANEAVLARLLEASFKSRASFPIGAGWNGRDLEILEISRLGRGSTTLLALRAMRNLGAGDAAAALSDLDACERIACLLGSGPQILMRATLAREIRGVSRQALFSVAFSGKVDATTLKRRAVRHARESEACDPVAVLEVERLIALAGICETLKKLPAAHAAASVMSVFDATVPKIPDPKSIDGDRMLREINRRFDRFEDAFLIVDPERRAATIEAVQREYQVADGIAPGSFAIIQAIEGREERWSSPEALQRHLVNTASSAPFVLHVQLKRGLLRRRFLAIAFALAAWKAERGAYPDRLDANELGLPAASLIDPETGSPFPYFKRVPPRRLPKNFVALAPDPDRRDLDPPDPDTHFGRSQSGLILFPPP
jgi:hypothetical protein